MLSSDGGPADVINALFIAFATYGFTAGVSLEAKQVPAGVCSCSRPRR